MRRDGLGVGWRLVEGGSSLVVLLDVDLTACEPFVQEIPGRGRKPVAWRVSVGRDDRVIPHTTTRAMTSSNTIQRLIVAQSVPFM